MFLKRVSEKKSQLRMIKEYEQILFLIVAFFINIFFKHIFNLKK